MMYEENKTNTSETIQLTDEEKEKLKKYESDYSEKSLFDKIIKVAKKAGTTVIYAALLLFYTLQDPNVPAWAKAVIVGALGYFISPVDFIPDMIPVIGYTDDLSTLIGAIVMVSMYIDEDKKNKAKSKLRDWFGNFDDSLLSEVDNRI